jgi:hypothetical protein
MLGPTLTEVNNIGDTILNPSVVGLSRFFTGAQYQLKDRGKRAELRFKESASVLRRLLHVKCDQERPALTR